MQVDGFLGALKPEGEAAARASGLQEGVRHGRPRQRPPPKVSSAAAIIVVAPSPLHRHRALALLGGHGASWRLEVTCTSSVRSVRIGKTAKPPSRGCPAKRKVSVLQPVSDAEALKGRKRCRLRGVRPGTRLPETAGTGRAQMPTGAADAATCTASGRCAPPVRAGAGTRRTRVHDGLHCRLCNGLPLPPSPPLVPAPSGPCAPRTCATAPNGTTIAARRPVARRCDVACLAAVRAMERGRTAA